MKRYAYGGIFFFLVAFSCANELSQEEEGRENESRAYDRLTFANGYFRGFINLTEAKRIPCYLGIITKKNPENTVNNPNLQVSMQVGLFGGVHFSTDNASFDWGTGEFSASFGRSSGSPLEVRSKIVGNKMIAPILVGPNEGMLPMELSAVMENETLSSQDNDRGSFNLHLVDDYADPLEGNGLATLSLENTGQSVNAPDFSDLPVLPALVASLRFFGNAQIPQTPNKILYYPLKGIVDLYYQANSKIRLTDVYALPEKIGPLALGQKEASLVGEAPAIRGEITKGGTTIQKVLVTGPKAQLTESETKNFELPPKVYAGSFQGEKDAPVYKAIVNLSYQGDNGVNASELIFPTFPKLQLQITLCVGDKPFAQANYQMNSIRYLESSATFIQTPSGNQSQLKLQFSRMWQVLRGTIISTDTATGAETSSGFLILSKLDSDKNQGCATEDIPAEAAHINIDEFDHIKL